jgi:hypothetical protein
MSSKDAHVWIHIATFGFLVFFSMYCSILLIMSAHDYNGMRIAAAAALLCAIVLGFRRDNYLPFLGETVLPASLLKDATSPANSNVETDIVVDAPDGSKVVYWGAAPAASGSAMKGVVAPSPSAAYKDYSNAGIAVVRNGVARVRFFCPVKYQVSWGKTIDRHIHYRVIDKNSSAMLGSVKTMYVNC